MVLLLSLKARFGIQFKGFDPCLPWLERAEIHREKADWEVLLHSEELICV